MKYFDREVLTKLCRFLEVKPSDLLVLVEQGDLFGTHNQTKGKS